MAAMRQTPAAPPSATFIERLRRGGVEPGDSAEIRLNKSLLMLATGLTSLTAVIWAAIYWWLGASVDTSVPMLFQLLLVGNMLIFIASRNFDFFRLSQLALFLFLPFVAQWAMGNFVTASGIVLWGLLAPIGALLCIGITESLGWFLAWAILTMLTGAADYYLADFAVVGRQKVPMRISLVFFALNMIAVASIIYMLLRHAMLERRKVQQKLESAHRQLQSEQARSERLLLNVLPGPVAERLKNSEQTIADGFTDASVMFADIVNFTQVAANMTPSQVFAMLNRIFSAFDELAETYRLEKIKTIGDAYMVAGGINQSQGDFTAATAELALAMRDVLRRDFVVNSAHLEIRIGIGTGPVVAGVVGKKKFIYDLWGDTVNIASRITSEAAPSMIQCDAATYERLRDRYDFMEPQALNLKGKGIMTVYRLIGRSGNVTD
jgi:class 3 adenylate cyclase